MTQLASYELARIQVKLNSQVGSECGNKIKLLNGKLVKLNENEVMENQIKVKTKYCVDIAVVDTSQK